MPAKKMRVEVFDEEGNRFTITFEGRVTRDKALCLLDIVELLGGVHDNQGTKKDMKNFSKYKKTEHIVHKYFPFTWFSSSEVLNAYEQECSEPVSLSTISTYLARMTDRGFLVRKGTAYNRKYRIMTKLVQKALGIAKDK